MEFAIQREELFKPLQLIGGVVDRKQAMPILSHILLTIDQHQHLSLTATDSEIELVAHAMVSEADTDGQFTVPARKLIDILRALDENQKIVFKKDNNRLVLVAGKSRFNLSTLAAEDFPSIDANSAEYTFTLSQSILKQLIEKTSFAMAQQDVRYYLNGLLCDFQQGSMTAVATDGHRLAMVTQPVTGLTSVPPIQIIVPRKAVQELSRLLVDAEGELQIKLSKSHFCLLSPQFRFTSQLIEGRFPDFKRTIPKAPELTVVVNNQLVQQVLGRVAVLSHNKHRSVRLLIEKNSIKFHTENSEHEFAEEELAVDYDGLALDMAFNINYLVDVLSSISTEEVVFRFVDQNSTVIIEPVSTQQQMMQQLYLVMPMR